MTSTNAPDPNELKFAALREDLHRRYDHALPAPEVDEVLDELIDRHRSRATVTTFLPIIVEREATAEIEKRAWGEGAATRRREVLFVCPHNTGRSQVASVVARHHAGNELLIRSVGPDPRPIENPEILRELQARGFDTSLVYPKELTSRTIHESDLVILLDRAGLSSYENEATETWDVPDPDPADAAGVAEAIDRISERVLDLLRRQGINVSD